jgi:hypothetical protein
MTAHIVDGAGDLVALSRGVSSTEHCVLDRQGVGNRGIADDELG